MLELLVQNLALLFGVGEIEDGVGIAHDGVELALGGFMLQKGRVNPKSWTKFKGKSTLMFLPGKGGLRVLQGRPDGRPIQERLGAWGGQS